MHYYVYQLIAGDGRACIFISQIFGMARDDANNRWPLGEVGGSSGNAVPLLFVSCMTWKFCGSASSLLCSMHMLVARMLNAVFIR